MLKTLHKTQLRAPQPVQQAAARCACCAVIYWLARLMLNTVCGVLLQWWLHGPGVGAVPVVWQALQWGGTLLCGALALAVPVLLAGRLWPGRYKLRIGPARTPQLRLALPVYLGAAQLFGLAMGLVGTTTVSSTQVTLPDTLPALMLSFLALCVVPAVLEELLFRGLAQGLMRPYGAWVAVVAQAVLFALLHGSLSGVIYALPAGLLFGLLAEQTGSILPGMLLHLCNNLLSFMQVLLQGAGYNGAATLYSVGCLVVFPLWAVVALLRTRKDKRFALRPFKSGVSAAVLLHCREWRFTVLVLAASTLLEAICR